MFSGARLPRQYIRDAANILRENQLLPDKGYLSHVSTTR